MLQRLSSPILFWHRLLLSFFFSCLGLVATAQLCTGSLGDPIVNITFGAGQGYAQPLGTSITDYKYKVGDCPIDGEYSVLNRTAQCFGNTWHSLTSDHTGDPSGYFMLVNASYTPGNFYVHTISGLCANTTYEFAAWLMNVMLNPTAIKPNLTFSIETIDGTVLKEYDTGDLPTTGSPQWKQYGFYFKTPEDATTIVLKITNNAPGGIGNDLALDDITFRPCGPNLTVTTTQTSDTIDMCQESPFPVTIGAQQATGFADPIFFWQQSRDSGVTWQDVSGVSNSTLLFQSAQPGSYWYRFSAAEKQNGSRQACRVASNIITINVHPTPLTNAGADKSILKGFTTRLGTHAAQAGYVYNWSPDLYMDSSNSARPQIQPDADIEYTLTTLSPWGCSSTDDVVVKVAEQLYIPNAFTPNGDGRNDVWRIPFLDVEMGAQVYVYNRYGQLVYKATGGNVRWDGRFNGKPQPAGTYIYHLQFPSPYPALKGALNLLR